MSQALDPVTQHHVDRRPRRWQREFAGVFSRETIARYIAESLDLLGGSRINVYVPVLAHRFARERLRALAQAEGTGREGAAGGPVRLRPQRRPQPDGCRAREAPLGGPHPRSLGGQRPGRARSTRPSIEAMTEIGVDMSEEFPKPLTDEVVRAADVVITMGCGDACPIYPGKRYEDWELDDPAGAGPRDGARGSATRSTRASSELVAELAPRS